MIVFLLLVEPFFIVFISSVLHSLYSLHPVCAVGNAMYQISRPFYL